jgi:hypothetical protein
MAKILSFSAPLPSARAACEAVLYAPNCASLRVETATSGEPYRAAQIFATSSVAKPDYLYFVLLVHLDSGFFAMRVGERGTHLIEMFGHNGGPPGLRTEHRSYDVPTLRVVDAIPGGAPELLLVYPDPGPPGVKEVIVCGIGPSGAPSCAQMLALSPRPGATTRAFPADYFGAGGKVTLRDDKGRLHEMEIRFP